MLVALLAKSEERGVSRLAWIYFGLKTTAVRVTAQPC